MFYSGILKRKLTSIFLIWTEFKTDLSSFPLATITFSGANVHYQNVSQLAFPEKRTKSIKQKNIYNDLFKFFSVDFPNCQCPNDKKMWEKYNKILLLLLCAELKYDNKKQELYASLMINTFEDSSYLLPIRASHINTN